MRVLVCTTVHVPVDARIHHRQVASLLAAGHGVTQAAPWSATGTAPPDAAGLVALDLPRAAGRRRVAALRAARRLIGRRGSSHDLVLLHDPELLLAVAGRLRRLPPVVLDVHEDLAASLGDRPWVPGPLRPAARWLARLAERWAERNLRLLLAEQAYRDRFRRPHPVVPNVPWLPDDPGGAGIAAEIEDRVVYLGRISAARGARELVEIGRRLAGEVDVELIGPVDADVTAAVEEAHAAGHVAWSGFLPNPEALARLPGSLAGLSLLHDEPNYRVSLPTKVLEYLSRRVPVITTPLPAARRVVAEHDAGVVVPFGDPGAAVEAIRRLRDDPDERAAMAERGRAAVAAEWCWDVAGPAFVRRLEQWAGAGR